VREINMTDWDRYWEQADRAPKVPPRRESWTKIVRRLINEFIG
jgi:hypothetical protein